MSRFFTGAASRIIPPGNMNGYTTGCISIWFKSTTATANTMIVAAWDGSSRNGCGLLLNTTANKLTAQCYNTTGTPAFSQVGATTINDGNWHHLAFNFNVGNGAAQQVFLDGASQLSGNTSATWAFTASSAFSIGGAPSFWATLEGNAAEAALWNRNLTADEIVALSKGFSARCIALENLDRYEPMVRPAEDRVLSGTVTVNGTASFADHCPVIGGLT